MKIVVVGSGGREACLALVLSRSAEDGEIVGHAEVIDTGEVVAVQDVDDLLALVRRLAD